MLQQLIERWEKAFDEIELLPEYHNSAKAFKYATGRCFELTNYAKEDFPPERSLTDTADNESVPYYQYGLRSDGLPCYTSFPYKSNAGKWEGYYRYEDHLVEYIEFNIQTGIPSSIERIFFVDSRKISFQSVFINTRGSAPAWVGLSKEEAILSLKNDKYSFQASIEDYGYEDNKIVKADCYGIAPGQGEYKFHKTYLYDQKGDLDEIRDFYSGGSSRLTYVRPEENYSLRDRSDRLAGLIAEAVVDTLIKNKVESPVAIVELGYQYVYTYLPVVIVRSESKKRDVIAEGGENIWEGLFLGFDELLHLKTDTFERLFGQFMLVMEKTANYESGRAMLRKSAALLTKRRLFDKIPVADEFVSYVIDHSVEGHSKEEFMEILKECGLEESIIEAWDKRGWLRP
jgi:hypothetical protein